MPIRLDADLTVRIEIAARRLGATKSAVIRLAILNQLPEIEAGQIHLRNQKAAA